jgi:hypothetical protein
VIELSDADVLARLTNTEDSTVERKTASDYRDCLKTAVAFSNSLAVGDPGIIFVGVGNNGAVLDNSNLDSLQMKISGELNKVFPPIFPQMKVMNKQGKEFLAVIVRGSENRPHFAGPSYVRDGSQTREASEQQFERLIAERNSKAREILLWKDQIVTVRFDVPDNRGIEFFLGGGWKQACRIVDCNQHYFTASVESTTKTLAHPLERLGISFDHNNDRLELILYI